MLCTSLISALERPASFRSSLDTEGDPLTKKGKRMGWKRGTVRRTDSGKKAKLNYRYKVDR